MKKYTQILRKFISRKYVLLTVVFVVGMLAGSLLTTLLTNESPKKTSPSRSSSNSSISTDERVKLDTERLETSVERSLKQIDTDVQSKKLTKEQADKLKVKVDEIKKYLSNVDRTDLQARKDLREKRTEWRKWADDNKLPKTYLIRLN